MLCLITGKDGHSIFRHVLYNLKKYSVLIKNLETRSVVVTWALGKVIMKILDISVTSLSITVRIRFIYLVL